MINLNSHTGCRKYLVDRRFSCRVYTGILDSLHDQSHKERRDARLFRESGNPILIRRADVLEERTDQRRTQTQAINQKLLEIGHELMEFSVHIDHHLSQSQILDLLNVNIVERSQVSPEDGVIQIAYARNLEDSAMFRGSDWRQGPLAQAITSFMQHELLHNEELQESASEYLFGKGGLMEFIPRYQQGENGEMVRMPPNLRLADECDTQTTGDAA
ncbi:MAG: hypothetical protein HON68_02720 [Gammaproteobacteria bacterium]|jgi:hypothetical protein|nr:hypothetical protein [Gammaproteobacteria bacterium]MBT5235830.1 hypothetical protein [Candidatus Neomarinimicrobiota bacterium]MBT3490398.1 hypothetical protein [Gammaproteobacteria bacterium]MBT3718136.1 hypothetical protein [Gammaproteobacteria bacterium]MBT3845550.1 hypothetical protein [Gammaproteobacteria bacterium]